mmetsp:Transcript_13813/g.15168  ORF Transcript_13813/g.15168 Transcript_13813/m.15168 type:complete len:514 (+) Transcript_13813:48-1589(+)
MGCSTSKHEAPLSERRKNAGIGATEHLPYPRKGIGQTERMQSKQAKEAAKSSSTKKETLAPNADGIVKEDPKVNENGHLMPEEVVKRTASSIRPKKLLLGNSAKGGPALKLRYAYLTQRGYYPDDVHKANQDSYSITNKFAGEDADSLFVVYDGHGKDGDICAKYAQKELPRAIAKYVRQKRAILYRKQLQSEGKSLKGAFNPAMWPILDEHAYEDACHKAHVEVNEMMHDDKNVPDAFSGTTAISACFHFGRLTVCNVGDSRAVMGHRVPDAENGEASVPNSDKYEEEKVEEGEEAEPKKDISRKSGRLLAIPLSRDQTPFRKDERERIKAEGGIIQSTDQMEGDQPIQENWGDMVLGEEIDIQGDPPRVWKEGKDYPGTAFTRSLGDSVGDEIGVYAEPEMLTTNLTKNDEILVIASDGVFEFMTNQAVIDICSQCDNPLEACQKVVKAAYDQWLVYEDRTDDITIICAFLECDTPVPTNPEGTTAELLNLASDTSGLKPVRKGASTNKIV